MKTMQTVNVRQVQQMIRFVHMVLDKKPSTKS